MQPRKQKTDYTIPLLLALFLLACLVSCKPVSKAVNIESKGKYYIINLTLIRNNTETNSIAIDSGEVDTEELASNLRYAIHEFTKALKEVERFNHAYSGK